MYMKEDDKNLKICKIHHKRKGNGEMKIFEKMLNMALAILIIGPGIITLSSGMPEDTIGENVQFQGESTYPNQQLVLLDVTYDHTTATKAFSFFNLPSGIPTNFISPINYAQGTIYQRLQVITKPSTKTVKYQFCAFQDQIIPSKHACTSEGLLAFTGPGTYYASQPMTSLYQYGNLNWGRNLLTQMLVVKDKNSIPVDDRYGWAGRWDGSSNFGLYYPMKVRYTAIIVPSGRGAPIWPSGSSGGSGSITVVSPNGGENLIRGRPQTISWSSSGSSLGAYVKIELLKGGVFNSVISSSTPNDGSHGWTIPTAQPLGTDYKVRVTRTSSPIYTDTSNSNFIIGGGSITVVYPNGGESWFKGTTRTISWSSTGTPGASVKIELWKGGTFNKVIALSTPNDGSYSWYIPTAQTVGTDFKIKIVSTTNSVYADSSNNYFKIN